MSRGLDRQNDVVSRDSCALAAFAIAGTEANKQLVRRRYDYSYNDKRTDGWQKFQEH